MLNNTYVYITVAFHCPDDEVTRLPVIPRDYITFDIINPNAIYPMPSIIPFYFGDSDVLSNQLIVDNVNHIVYNQLPQDSETGSENRLLTVRIPLSIFLDQEMLYPKGSTYVLSEFDIRVYWHGESILYLDYIEVEDSIHKGMKDNAVQYRTNVNNRINKLKSLGPAGVIELFYGFDEPNQPQFDSYELVQNLIDNNQPNLVSAIYDWQRRMTKSNSSDPLDKYYQHQVAFIESVSPKYFSPDLYPISPQTVWNDASDTDQFVQNLLERNLLCRYNKFKTEQMSSNDPYKFYPVVQSFGHWKGSYWESWLRPPAETQKMLQYLPLCYQADGIINYVFPTFTDGNLSSEKQYGPLLILDQRGALSYQPQTNYYALQEANKKILKYHDSISESKWEWAINLTVNGNDSESYLGGTRLESLYVEPNAGIYQGFVQCGFYLNSETQPMFMLVNKRANYLNPNAHPHNSDNASLDSCFCVPDSQSVLFVPDTSAGDIFGTHIALYDPYDDQVHKSISGVIDVELASGDGKLLQMCSSLPALVTNDADIKSIAYLSGNIIIDQGAVVTIFPGTTTNIFANSTIRVKGGSTLNISGTVEIADSVSIIVEDGSEIIFNNAICNWGLNSILQVDDSGIIATGTILQSTNIGEPWQGLRISNADTIDMEGTTITGAISNEVTDSPVLLTDCRFNIPTNGTGLSIMNNFPDQTARITSTTGNKGFYSIGSNGTGLYHDNPNAHLFLNNIVFDGLIVGFGNGLSTVVGDTIQYCYFSNNSTGMHLVGLQYSPLIQNCTFSENSVGAYFETTSPKVTDCSFISCDEGIRTELSTATTGGIFDSEFSLGEIGIVSRGSNQRVADNKFYTNTGILNHAGSILNMGNSAQNVFKAEQENLKFKDTVSYTARVQLYGGHNDFYHKNPGPFNPSIDFQFDSNWNVGGLFFSPINASYNWFEDDIVKIDSPGTPSHYAYCNYYDPSPNVFLENNDRMAQAMNEESAENYYSANNMYKTILDENEISEAELLFDALDAYYRTADLAGVSNPSTEAYLLAKIDQYETENSILIKYLEDYLVKNYLQAESFQAAIDLLELRILNAESPVDSLHAVMNLEIVLQLAAMSASKKPISTKFTQYKYPDRLTFKLKHEEHWELLDELLNHEDINLIPIPAKALISSNYPNPFNPSTTIAYSIPKDGMVRIGIYNIKGQKVKELCNSEMQRGHHKVLWDGKDAKRRNVSSGIYFVKLQASGAVSTRKIMLMK